MDKEEALTVERKKIDAIDRQITQLLEQRMDAVNQIALIKGKTDKQVLDAEREAKVLNQVASGVENPQYKDTITATFKEIMKHSRAYQKQKISGENAND